MGITTIILSKMTPEDQVAHFVREAGDCGVPQHCQSGLANHIIHGRETGDFLEAVLSNNLMMAVSYADNENQKAIHAYCNFLFNRVPSGAFGSPEKVKSWREGGGLIGLQAKSEGEVFHIG